MPRRWFGNWLGCFPTALQLSISESKGNDQFSSRAGTPLGWESSYSLHFTLVF